MAFSAARLYAKSALWGAIGGGLLICVPALVLRLFESEFGIFELAAYTVAVVAPFVCIVCYRMHPATNLRRLLLPLTMALAAAAVSSLALWLDELHMYGIGWKDLAQIFALLGGELVIFAVPLSFIITWYPRRRSSLRH